MLPQLLNPRPYFAHLPDPRREARNQLYKLHDILMKDHGRSEIRCDALSEQI